jgi:hypothetical protein
MSGAIPPLPNTPPRRGAQLKHRDFIPTANSQGCRSPPVSCPQPLVALSLRKWSLTQPGFENEVRGAATATGTAVGTQWSAGHNWPRTRTNKDVQCNS